MPTIININLLLAACELAYTVRIAIPLSKKTNPKSCEMTHQQCVAVVRTVHCRIALIRCF